MSDTVDPGDTHLPQTETPDPVGAFPRLSDEQIDVLLERGRRRRLAKGEVLIRPGDHPSSLYVVLDGYLLTTDTEPADDPRPADEPSMVVRNQPPAIVSTASAPSVAAGVSTLSCACAGIAHSASSSITISTIKCSFSVTLSLLTNVR